MELLKPQNALVTSLVKALEEIDEKWESYPGLIIPGSWPGQDDDKFIQEVIPEIQKVKNAKIPFLGLCLGMQAIGIMEGGELVKMVENRQGIYRVLGWWGETQESHWHRFKVVGDFPDYDIYRSENVIEIMRLRDHPFFVGTQFHPEFQSSKGKPHPILKEFISICSIADGRQV